MVRTTQVATHSQRRATPMHHMPAGFPLKPLDCNGRPLIAGDMVRILRVESCAKGLPVEDQRRLAQLAGKLRRIVEFDRFGFAWLAFSATDSSADFSLFPSELVAAEPSR
jgi:hypothetical protein